MPKQHTLSARASDYINGRKRYLLREVRRTHRLYLRALLGGLPPSTVIDRRRDRQLALAGAREIFALCRVLQS